jgi:hypothetical protein
VLGVPHRVRAPCPAHTAAHQVHRGLDHLAPAVLAGIAAVELSSVLRHGDPGGSLLTLAAMTVVAGIAYRFGNLSLTVVAALAAVLVIEPLVV